MTDRQRTCIGYFVPPSPHFAGVERVVHEIATGLAEEHADVLDVHVFFATRYDDRLLVKPSYNLHVLDVDRLRKVASSLRSAVATNEIDILVCAQVEPSVIAWLATRGLGLTGFVAHLHGNPRLEERNGTLRTRVAFSLFRNVISRRVSGVLAVAPSLQKYAAQSLSRHAPVVFARNPARFLGDGETGPRPRTGEFRLLNVGRLDRQKGQDVLLRALAIARPSLPPTRLTIVGSGPDEPALRELSRHLGLSDIVDFPGYLPDPATHFGNADCFVLSSRWEGFPLVLLEALRFGLPILAADCDFGPRDLVTDPRIGDLVPVEDAAALADGLVRAASRVSDADAEAFRRRVASAYGRSEATASHFDALWQILSTRDLAVLRPGI
ncbi:MAG: glycosyltransferase [Pseudonocardia sp.]